MAKFDLPSKYEDIDDKILKIEGKVFRYGNTIGAIDNISRIKIGPALQRPSPLWSIVLIVIGALFFAFPMTMVIGLIMIGIGVGVIIYINSKNDERGRRLIIYLNSGSVLQFECGKQDFLDEVLDNFATCINKGSGNIVFNLQESTIVNSPMGNTESEIAYA